MARCSNTVKDPRLVKGKKKGGLVRVRSHLLPESRLISLPRGTEMFHFPRYHSSELTLPGNQRPIAVCSIFAFRGGVRPHPRRPGHPPGASSLSTIPRIPINSGSSGGDRTHGPRSMNPMLVPLSYTASKGSLSSRSQSSGKANLQRETSRLWIVYTPLNALTSVEAVGLAFFSSEFSPRGYSRVHLYEEALFE